jgi:uncharacterized C2H2 Zn-finger protein
LQEAQFQDKHKERADKTMPSEKMTEKPGKATGNEESEKFKCKVCGEDFNTEIEHSKHYEKAHGKTSGDGQPRGRLASQN